MQQASKTFKDIPLKALETGKFWVETVLHNKDVSQLRPSSLMITLGDLDVYVIIFLIAMLTLSIPFVMIKKLVLACWPRILRQSTIKLKTN